MIKYTIDYMAKSYDETGVVLHSVVHNTEELESEINWLSNNGFRILKVTNEDGCKN